MSSDWETYGPGRHGRRLAGVVVRPALPVDCGVLARLSGRSGEESERWAARVLEQVPVLLVADWPGAAGVVGWCGAHARAEVPVAQAVGIAVGQRGGGAQSTNGVGSASVRQKAPVGTESSGTWLVAGLRVDPTVRRRGVGRALLEAVSREVARRGAAVPGAGEQSSLVLRRVVNTRNTASVALHEACGFSVIRSVTCYAGVTFDGGEGLLLQRCLSGDGSLYS